MNWAALLISNVTVDTGWIVAIGGLVTALATAAGILAGRLAKAKSELLKAQGEYDTAKVKSGIEERKAEAEHEAAITRLRADAHAQVRQEYQEIIDRLQEEIGRRDTYLARQELRIDELYKEVRECHDNHHATIIQCERQNQRIALLEETIAGIQTRQSLADMPTRMEAVVIADANGKIRDWPPVARLLFQWGSHEIVGKSIETLIPKDYLEAHRRAFKRCIDSNARVRRGPYFVEGLTRNGERIPVELVLSSWDEDGKRYISASIRRREAMAENLSVMAMATDAGQVVADLTDAAASLKEKATEAQQAAENLADKAEGI